jgi:hypothetical protein
MDEVQETKTESDQKLVVLNHDAKGFVSKRGDRKNDSDKLYFCN